MFSYILHHFSIHCVIHQFEEILLEIICSASPKLDVEIDLGFHPGRLGEFNCSMNALQNQSMQEGLIQCSNVDNIILLVVQVGNQLFDSACGALHASVNFHSFTHEWKIVMRIVQLSGVTNIDLLQITFVCSSR